MCTISTFNLKFLYVTTDGNAVPPETSSRASLCGWSGFGMVKLGSITHPFWDLEYSSHQLQLGSKYVDPISLELLHSLSVFMKGTYRVEIGMIPLNQFASISEIKLEFAPIPNRVSSLPIYISSAEIIDH